MKRAAELDAAGWGPKKPKSAAAIWVNAPGGAVHVQQWERTVNRQPVAAVYPAGAHRSFSAAELLANRRRYAPATRAGGGSGMTEDLRVGVATAMLLVPERPTPPIETTQTRHPYSLTSQTSHASAHHIRWPWASPT